MVPPGRKWYLVALIVLVAGGVGDWSFITARLAALEAKITRFVAPGTMELTLDQPGVTTIFHEPKSVVDGTYYASENINGLHFFVAPAAGGAPLPLGAPGGSETYDMGGHAGTAVLTFNAPAAGHYRLTAGYDDNRAEPKAVMGVAQNFVGGLLSTVFGGIAIGFATVVAAIAIAVVTYIKRQPAQPIAAPSVAAALSVAPPSAMRYAGPMRRAVDGTIDIIASLVVLWIVAKIAGHAKDGGFDLSGWPALIGFVCVLLYFIVMEATLGATLGKLLVDVRVVNEADGSAIGWGAAVVRTLLRFIDCWFFYLVGFIMVCVTDKRQRIGDKAAGTVVIRRTS